MRARGAAGARRTAWIGSETARRAVPAAQAPGQSALRKTPTQVAGGREAQNRQGGKSSRHAPMSGAPMSSLTNPISRAGPGPGDEQRGVALDKVRPAPPAPAPAAPRAAPEGG